MLLVALAAAAGHLAAPASAAELRVENSLVFTRADGSTVPFAHHVRVWCGRWESDVPVRALHLTVGRPASRAVWLFRAIPRDVRRRPEVRLPHRFVWNRPTGADLFAVDGDNELSSASETSAGRIVVGRARCGRRLAVRIRIDATLGSEFIDGPPLAVRGSFRASSTR